MLPCIEEIDELLDGAITKRQKLCGSVVRALMPRKTSYIEPDVWYQIVRLDEQIDELLDQRIDAKQRG